MSDIDLESTEPVKMFTAADYAKDYTFMLVAENNKYTSRAFIFNPNVVPGSDIIFKSPAVKDDQGRALVDLVPQYDAIKKKLKDPKTPARAVVVATSREKNRDPRKRDAIVQRVTISKKAQSIKLKPLRGTASKPDWITYHHSIIFVEMEAKGIGQISFETDPKTPWGNTPCMVSFLAEQTRPGALNVDRMLLGGVGDPCNGDSRCPYPASMHGNWWPLWATQIAKKNGPITVALPGGKTNFLFGLYPRYPGQYVLTVKGTGPFADVSDKVNIAFNGAHPNPGD